MTGHYQTRVTKSPVAVIRLSHGFYSLTQRGHRSVAVSANDLAHMIDVGRIVKVRDL